MAEAMSKWTRNLRPLSGTPMDGYSLVRPVFVRPHPGDIVGPEKVRAASTTPRGVGWGRLRLIMPKTRTPERFPARVELLEGRTLLAWGTFPQLIDQDQAVAKYAQYNGAGQTIAV